MFECQPCIKETTRFFKKRKAIILQKNNKLSAFVFVLSRTESQTAKINWEFRFLFFFEHFQNGCY